MILLFCASFVAQEAGLEGISKRKEKCPAVFNSVDEDSCVIGESFKYDDGFVWK